MAEKNGNKLRIETSSSWTRLIGTAHAAKGVRRRSGVTLVRWRLRPKHNRGSPAKRPGCAAAEARTMTSAVRFHCAEFRASKPWAPGKADRALIRDHYPARFRKQVEGAASCRRFIQLLQPGHDYKEVHAIAAGTRNRCTDSSHTKEPSCGVVPGAPQHLDRSCSDGSYPRGHSVRPQTEVLFPRDCQAPTSSY